MFGTLILFAKIDLIQQKCVLSGLLFFLNVFNPSMHVFSDWALAKLAKAIRVDQAPFKLSNVLCVCHSALLVTNSETFFATDCVVI